MRNEMTHVLQVIAYTVIIWQERGVNWSVLLCIFNEKERVPSGCVIALGQLTKLSPSVWM